MMEFLKIYIFDVLASVQHLLSEDALIDWRKLDDWYREEDLTSKVYKLPLSNPRYCFLVSVV